MARQSRLERDIDRWIASGWIEAAHREAILQDAARRSGRWSAAGAGLILGAVLLALAALSFVAANWADMPRLFRFAMILAALWAAFLGAGEGFRRNNPALGHALALVGAALFGAAIMLTAQTFNISAFRNTGILIWALGALAVAVAIPSRPVLALSALLGGSWMILEAANPLTPRIVWGFIPLWAGLAVMTMRMASPLSANLLGAAAIIWLASLVFFLQGEDRVFDGSAPPILLALLCGAGAMVFALAEERGVALSRIISRWLATGAIIAAFIAQFSVREQPFIAMEFMLPAVIAVGVIGLVAYVRYCTGHIRPVFALSVVAAAVVAAALPPLTAIGEFNSLIEIVAGAVVFAIAAAMVAEGARAGRGFTGGLGLVLFIAQALHVYTALFGSLLDTALFFLIGGLLLIAMSVIAMRVQSRKQARTKEAQP